MFWFFANFLRSGRNSFVFIKMIIVMMKLGYFLKCLNHEIALSHISLRNHHQRLSPSQTSGTFPPLETSGTFSQPPNIIRSSHHPKLLTGFYHSKPPTCFHNRPPSSEALTIGNLTALYEVLVSCI